MNKSLDLLVLICLVSVVKYNNEALLFLSLLNLMYKMQTDQIRHELSLFFIVHVIYIYIFI